MTTTMTDLQTGKTHIFNEALPGRDAYELALAEGFQGTRAEWLASLKGLDFDPEKPNWESDRSYPPRAAVIHAHSFWFARVADLGTEPGTNDAIWMKLVHGEDAGALTQALELITALRDTAETLLGASVEAAARSTASLWFLSQTAETQTFILNPAATTIVSQTASTITVEIAE